MDKRIMIMALALVAGCFASSADSGRFPQGVSSGASSGDGETEPGTEGGAADGASLDGSGGSCAQTGTCGQGAPCSDEADCSSGYCADGVCCDLPCEGSCQTCSQDPGTCRSAEPGTDPDLECSPGVCGSSQECVEGHLEWARGFGAPVDVGEGRDWTSGVVVDNAGNVFAIGTFEGSVELGGNVLTSAGAQDIFVVALGPGGEHLWSRRYGNSGHDVGSAITRTPGGDIVVAGAASGDPGFPGEWPADGSLRGFVLALGPDGTTRASAAIVSDQSSRAQAVAIGSGGEVFVAGGFHGTLSVDTPRASAGDEDLFLAQLDDALDPQWSWARGEAGKDFARGIATSPAGAVAITWYMSSTQDTPSDGSREDVYIASFSGGPAASPSWEQRHESAVGHQDKGHDVEFFSGGDLAVAGFFSDEIDFGLGPLTSAGASDGFVARLRGDDGAGVWAFALGGGDQDAVHGLAIDVNDELIVSGRIRGSVLIAGAELLAEGQDLFAARLSPQAEHLWSTSMGGEGSDIAHGVSLDASGNAYVSGLFSGQTNIGEPPLAAAEQTDALIMRLSR